MIDNTDEHADKCTLVFVYNADAGLFNTLTDIAHKVFSPSTYQCHLCELSHGYFTMREEWSEFIRDLDMDGEYLHRDEFISLYGDHEMKFPAILERRGKNLELRIDAASIDSCNSIEELKALIKQRCFKDGSQHDERKTG